MQLMMFAAGMLYISLVRMVCAHGIGKHQAESLEVP